MSAMIVQRLAYNGDVLGFKMGRRQGDVSAGRRAGVSAFAKRHQLRRNLLSHCSRAEK
jgi:hypothetical protein